ncbi:MAG: hypothetical protein EKK39_11860 [Sphingobacteriales bacterium]|uniref:hypothetical protein n=1 Tax=Hydrotalea flava TaxID=714549 RepID=UPI000FAE36EE|nr:hypothetical protein [Hydrotalea flava]RTL48832.1 MAG: hypothetical protein EKK39_11860 [Sphingobacteriales bacterium]
MYDTKMNFRSDSPVNVVEGGKYIEAENSGDWLDNAYLKQQSDEFKVYQGFSPGAQKIKTYELPPDNGGGPEGDIDFTSYCEVSRSGNSPNYTYTVSVKIYDAYTHTIVTTITQSTTDLGKVDYLIDQAIASYSPTLDKLRDYQKKVRDESGGKKWIGLKFKATADKTNLKIGETTNVHIKIFDCADEKPVPNQQLNIRLGTPKVGIINNPNVKTNSSGEAVLIFTAKNEGETTVFPDFTYTAVNGKSGYHVLKCGNDELKIQVEDEKYKLTMNVNITGADGLHWQLSGEVITKLISYADGTFQLKAVDGTRNMPVHVLSASTRHMKLIGKYDYTIPFTLNIGNIYKKGTTPAKIAFDTFSPSENGWISSEPYRVKDGVVDLPGFTSHLVQNLFYDIEKNVAKKSKTKEYQELAEVEQIKAHAKDANYWHTAQGKSDMLKLQKIMEERGRGDLFTKMSNSPLQHSKADSAFVEGMRGTQFNPSAYGLPPMKDNPSIMGNFLQFTGTFNNQSETPLNIFQENDINGALQGSITIKVEKLK